MSISRRIECSKDLLGKGGFATVFTGRFDSKDVAVKRMLVEDVEDREEEFLKKYPHPNILKLLHVEEDGPFK